MSFDNVIVGLGKTGLSCARFFLNNKKSFAVMDTRAHPPGLSELKALAPDVPLYLSELDKSILSQAHEIILSPGLSVHHPVIAELIREGKSVVGDIELFARLDRAPIIAITGSNGKSTVASMLHAMAKACGIQTELGGNIGVPVLDLLEKPTPDYYILELSSFQLMSTTSLRPLVATVLNLSENHLDHHKSMDEYYQAKMKVYQGCRIEVCNKEEKRLCPGSDQGLHRSYFTSGLPGVGEYGVRESEGIKYLAHNIECLLPLNELQEIGHHFYMNAAAALALACSLGWSPLSACRALKNFQGLPHRCRLVLKRDEVSWYDDSKGTTVVAALAAINSLRPEIEGNLVMILGGVGKGADFSPLIEGMKGKVAKAILIGESAPQLASLLKHKIPFERAQALDEAVLLAKKSVADKGFVLFSPACASYDMFKDFEHRGDEFIRLVKELY